MKRHLRILSLLICLTLLISSAPLSLSVPKAYASEQSGDELNQAVEIQDILTSDEPGIDSEQLPVTGYEIPPEEDFTVEEQVNQADSDIEAAEAIGDNQSAEDNSQALSDEVIPADDAENTVAPEPTKVIDYAADASMSPEFRLGYAEVLLDDTPAYDRADVDAQALVHLSRGIVYAFERTIDASEASMPDRLHIAFNLGGEAGIVEAWVDAQLLRPMEPVVEVDAYRQFCAELDELAFYHGDAELPLARIAYILPEVELEPSIESPVPTATSHPVVEPAVSEDESQAEPEAEATHPIIMPAVPPETDTDLAAPAEEVTEVVVPTESESVVTPDAAAEVEPDATPEMNADMAASAEGAVEAVNPAESEPTSIPAASVKPAATPEESQLAEYEGETDHDEVPPDGFTMPVTQEETLEEPILEPTYASPEIVQESLELYAGTSALLELTLPKGSIPLLSSSDTDVAEVTAKGLVNAIAPGIAVISISDGNQSVDACIVTVRSAPARIELTEDMITLTEQELGHRIVAKAYDGEDAIITCDFIYEVDEPSIVEVQAGELIPHSAGNATVHVRVKDFEDVQAPCSVQVMRNASSISLRRASITLGIGDSFQLSDGPDGIIMVPENERVASYSFTSNNAGIAAVDTNGMITAKKKGSTTIHIKPNGAKEETLSVKVNPASTNIAFNVSQLTLGACSSTTLQVGFSSGAACDYSISSSDPNGELLSFERDGDTNNWTLKAGKVFEPTIVTLTVRSTLKGYSDSCAVMILPGPKSDEIEFTSTKTILGVSEQGGKVSAVIAPGINAVGGFTYSSDKPSILNVAEDGSLEALDTSETPVTITARANVPWAEEQYAKASLSIQVVDYPDIFELNAGKETLKLGVGDSYSIENDPDNILRIEPEGARTSFEYEASSKSTKSASTSIITVTAGGLITAKKAGTAYVRITPQSHNDLGYIVLKVVVSKVAGIIQLSQSSLRLGIGMTGSLNVDMLPSKTYLHFVTDNSAPEVLTLTAEGEKLTLTPKQAGSAVITVQSDNSLLMDSCEVTVLEAPTEEDIKAGLHAPDSLAVQESGASISVTLPEDKLADISFESEEPNVLKVDPATGALTVQKVPTDGKPVSIRILVNGDPVYSHDIEILRAPETLILEQNPVSIEVDKTYQITNALVHSEAGTLPVCTYEICSDKDCKKPSTSVASVNGDGLITAKKKGTAYLHITANGNKKAEVKLKVNVLAKNSGLSLSLQKPTLGVGMNSSLSASNATEGLHFAYDSDIIELIENEDGTVTVHAVAPGSAVIRAGSTDACVDATATVTVLQAPTAQQLAFSADSTRRLSAGMKNAKVSAIVAEGTMAELAYRIVGETPSGIGLNENTGALTAASNASSTGSFTVEAYDVHNPAVSITHKVQLVPAAEIKGLSESTIQLGVGESYRISDGPEGIIQLASGDEDAAASYTFTIYSDSKYKKKGSSIADVNATTGVVTGKEAGKAYIKIVSDKGGTAQKLTVEVYAPPTTAIMSPAIFTLGAGMTASVTSNYKSGCSYTSSNEAVARVNSAGTVTAIAAGEAVIRLITWNGLTDTSVLRVCNAPETVVMSPADGITIGIGQKNAYVSAEPGEEGTMASFRYASENQDVVNIDPETGELAPKSPGVTNITATVNGSSPAIIGRTTVTVKAAPTNLKLHTSSIQLGVGDSYQITEYDAQTNFGDIEPIGEDVHASYTYYASTKSNKNVKSTILEISADGLITAKKIGTAYVRITEQTEKYTVAIKVTVSKAAGNISLSAPELILGIGMSGDLAVKFPPKTYSHYSIESSDTTIASIVPNDNADQFTVTAHAIGEATVIVRTDSGKLDSCHVRVLPGTENINWTFIPPVGGSVHTDTEGAYILGVGEKKAALTAVPDEGTLADFSFSSDVPSVLAVDVVTGELTPKATGKSNITIKTGDGEKAPFVSVPFVVLDMPANGALTLTQSKLRLGVGDTYQLSESPNGIISLSDDSSASYTFKSSNTSVATVDANGLITAKKAGSAKIRISTQNTKVYKDLAVTVSKYSESMSIVPSLSLGAGMTATLTPGFAKDTFSVVDYTVSRPDLLALSVDISTGVCTLTASKSDTLDVPKIVTVTARQQKTGLTYNCIVTLLPEPKAGGIEFDFSAMHNVETGADGAHCLSVGVREKGVSVVARCTDSLTFCEFEYKVEPDNSGLSVDADGVLSAAVGSEGHYTVTALAKNNPEARAELEVKVVPEPDSVDFSVSQLSLGVEESFQLIDSREGGIITLDPPEARASFTFSASKYSDKVATTNILSISEDGIITAKKTGTAYVKVTTQNKKNKILEVKIYKTPTGFSLNQEPSEIGELSSGKLTLNYEPENSYSILKDASSSNPELLSIDQSGFGKDMDLSFSTGKLPDGKAQDVVINVTTFSGAEESVTVHILPHPTKISFVQVDGAVVDSYELSYGMTLPTRLSFPEGTMAQNLRYQSSDENIATIDENGVISGTNKSSETQSTTITVTANPGTEFAVSESVKVIVHSAPATFAFEGLPDVVKLSKGDVVTIPEPVARSENGEIIPVNIEEYKSTNKTYVSVTGNMMKAVKTGKKVSIEARTNNGMKASFYVQVYDSEPDDLELYWEGEPVNNGTLNMYVNNQHPTDSLKLNWEVSGKNVNYASVSFTSSEPDIVTVDERGVITALDMGTADITAVSRGLATAQCTVVVGKLCADPKLETPTELLLDDGESEVISIDCQPEGSGMRFKYASDDGSVASVDGDGKITAIKGGSTNITITGQYGWHTQIHVKALYYPDSISLIVSKLSMAAPEPFPDSDKYEGASESIYDSVVLEPAISRTGVSQLELIDFRTEATSEDENVVEVKPERSATETEPASYKLIAKGEGSTTITIHTKRDGTFATCEVTVGTSSDMQDINGFGWDVPDGKQLVLMQGDEAPVELSLSSDIYNGNDFSIDTEPEGILSYDEQSMTVHGLAVGKATLTLIANGESMETAEIQVINHEKPRLLYGNNGALTEELPSKANMDVSSFTADFAYHRIRLAPLRSMDNAVLLGTFRLDIADPTLLEYDPETSILNTTSREGTTGIAFTTYGGTVSSEVNVLAAPVYRALLISEYNRSGNKNDLPFSQGNIDKMEEALHRSDIAGQRYDITVLERNATEEAISNAIYDTFANAKANDVSLIYIVSHGSMGSGKYKGQYCFSLSHNGIPWSTGDPSTFVTDSELMDMIKASPAMAGKVVLVIDSCNSGGFISHQQGNLNKMDNLAVITAQVKSKNASYFVGPFNGVETFEFFTRAFVTSLGHPVNVGAGDEWNDAASGDNNEDGWISVNEAFTQADKLTQAMVRKYCSPDYFNEKGDIDGDKGFKAPGISTYKQASAWLKDSKTNYSGQDPVTHIPEEMKDLVIIG